MSGKKKTTFLKTNVSKDKKAFEFNTAPTISRKNTKLKEKFTSLISLINKLYYQSPVLHGNTRLKLCSI
jgi:hypothetical protein